MPKGLIVIEGAGPRSPGAPWAPLARVAGRPLVLHAHDALRAAGAGSVIVVGPADALEALRPALDVAASGTVALELAAPGSAGDALLAAAGWLDGDDVIVHSGAGLLLRGAEPLRRAFAAGGGHADATVFFASARRRGLQAERVTGVHVFSERILPALAEVEPGEDGRSLLDAVDRLAAFGGRVRAAVLESWWQWDEARQTTLV
jgi:dTDP-glucose pyrophosphorylase